MQQHNFDVLIQHVRKGGSSTDMLHLFIIERIKITEFIVWTKFQNLTLHIAHIAIKLDIKSMNVHLLKTMWGKDLLNISKIWI